MQLSVNEQIIIFDEAHNIEDSSRDAASVLITKFQLEQAIADLNKVLDPKSFFATSEENVPVCHYFIEIVSYGLNRKGNLFETANCFTFALVS